MASSKSIEQAMAELLDREAIRDLPVRYCHCVWRNDLASLVNLFTEDAVFIVKGPRRTATFSGHGELRKMYEDAVHGARAPRPYIHNHVVELRGDGQATGTCYVELHDANQQLKWVASGFYDDEYRKLGGQWRFHSRTFTPVWDEHWRHA